jgi:uncharacterized UPF0146 family protein
MDINNISNGRNNVINNSKICYSYESPFPDYDIINEYKLEDRNIYDRLNIDYSYNKDLLNLIVNKYIPDWQPIDYDDNIRYCYNAKYNFTYSEYDAFILYCFIRYYKPKKIIEIGSGMSTRVMVDAINKENIDCSITSIDKYTSINIKNNLQKLNVNFIDEDIINIDLSIFENLEENDIYFIDSSHVLKNYGDVELEYLKILPSLKKGVIVHVHDIFLPYNYSKIWTITWKCVLTEQQLLACYLHNNKTIDILSANNYNIINNINVPDSIKIKCGGSLWFQNI